MIEKLLTRLEALRTRVDALTLRERALIFMGVMVVLYMLAVNLVFTPLDVNQARVGKELISKREQIQSLNAKIESIVKNRELDPDAENRVRLAGLQQRLRELESNLEEMTTGFVSPQQMAKLVEQILLKNRRLEILKVENLVPSPIGGDGDQTAAADAPAGEAGVSEPLIYKHGMRIELRGRYFDIVDYLKALEGLPWKVFWGEVSLESEKYPISRISLIIYTLGRDTGWIGV